MSAPTLVLLPGMDGTGDLLAPLLNIMPASIPRRVILYPTDHPLSYTGLNEFLENELRSEEEIAILAESFSGPLGVRYTSSHPERVRALVLIASFVASPRPRWLRYLVKPWLFRIWLPDIVLKYLIAGWNAPDSLVRLVKKSLQKVSPEVLACRLTEVFNVDYSGALRTCPVPLLYLAGARDRLVPHSYLQTIQAIRPDAAIRTINAPHLLLQTEPEVAWRHILGFLNDLPKWGENQKWAREF
jgi:pimeloyl-ACP methyl ester carboxylesterase